MSIDLHPRSLVALLARSFLVFRAQFASLAGVTLAASVPYAFFLPLVTPNPGAANEAEISPLLLGLNYLFLIGIAPLVNLTVTRKAADAYLGGTTSIGDHVRSILPTYVFSVATIFLMMLLALGAALLFVIPMLYFMVCWSLLAPVLVVERVFGRAALKRSRALVRGSWWRTSVVLFFSLLTNLAPWFLVKLTIGSVPVVGPLLMGIVQGIGGAFVGVVFVAYYFDLRSRKEDMNLPELARRLGPSEPHDLPIPTTPSPEH